MMYVTLYLAAIVLANLSSAHFGPGASVANAFFLIGLDLTSRDRLHDAWHGHRLGLRMAVLIGAGAALSWLLNRDAGRVALASVVAFAASALIDAASYGLLGARSRLLRVNGSNAVSALADSLLFPWLAFGGWLPGIVAGQWLAKVLGGLVWFGIFGAARRGWRRVNRRDLAAAR